MAANPTTVDLDDAEVIGALDVIRRHARLKKTAQVFTEAGIKEATAYRRLHHPTDLKVGELAAIAKRFGVPLHIIAEGELATARWFKENPSDHGPGGLGSLNRAWNGERRARVRTRRMNLVSSAAEAA